MRKVKRKEMLRKQTREGWTKRRRMSRHFVG
jgi:hypothetical protein